SFGPRLSPSRARRVRTSRRRSGHDVHGANAARLPDLRERLRRDHVRLPLQPRRGLQVLRWAAVPAEQLPAPPGLQHRLLPTAASPRPPPPPSTTATVSPGPPPPPTPTPAPPGANALALPVPLAAAPPAGAFTNMRIDRGDLVPGSYCGVPNLLASQTAVSFS